MQSFYRKTQGLYMVSGVIDAFLLHEPFKLEILLAE